MWETWRRSPQLPSYCTPAYAYNSLNVEEITFKDPDFVWGYTKDHAKWGLSEDAETPVVCIGGINRMSSQRSRGGGTVCLKDPSFYASMRAIISKVDTCTSVTA